MSLDLDPKYIKECKDGMEALMRALIEKHGSSNDADEKKDEEMKDEDKKD